MVDIRPNPRYGEGRFRRAIRLQGSNGMVLGELEDDCHGFRVRLLHDGERVTAVEGEALRIPMTTCGGAAEPLRALAGLALDTDPATINAEVNPRANCTHMYDLAVLCIAHARRGNAERRYDVVVEDDRGAGSELVVYRDAKPVHRWVARDYAIAAPPEFAGKPLMQGFAQWANASFTGEAREAAFVAMKGFFVSRSREYDMSGAAGTPGSDLGQRTGVCYSYSEPQISHAIRLDSVRDFSETPEQLLQFVVAD